MIVRAVLVALAVSTAIALPAAADPATPTKTATLDCTNPIGGTPPPRAEIVGGRVALLTARTRDQAMQAPATSDRRARYRYFAKSPLYVRAERSTARIVIPRSEWGRVAVSWGNTDHDGIATRVFDVGPCPGHAGWIVFPGGYSVSAPHCVTLVVHAGADTRRARVGVGVACPGQRPPPGG